MKGPAVRKIASTVTGTVIPVISARGLVFSGWVPSPEELAAIVSGSPLWLVQRGPYIPDMTLRICSEAEVIPHDLMQAAISEAVPGGDRYEQAVEKWKPTAGDRFVGRIAVAAVAVLVGAFVAWMLT